MKTLSTQDYRENRSKISVAELQKVDGSWVAISATGEQIVASAPTIQELSAQMRLLGEDLQQVVIEHIELESDNIHLGGEELL